MRSSPAGPTELGGGALPLPPPPILVNRISYSDQAADYALPIKGDFESEDTGKILRLQHKYSK